MSIVIGSMILCVIGTFILMWICSMLMGDGGISRSNELSAFEKLWVSNIVTKESIPSYSGLR